MASNLDNMKLIVKEFVTDLRDNVFVDDEERGEIMLVELYFNRMHPEYLMKHFSDKVLPYSKKIRNRNVDFFLDNQTSIFAGLPSSRVGHYSNVIVSEMGDDERELIWEYFDIMLSLAESYKKTP